jgi:hypothetical protein
VNEAGPTWSSDGTRIAYRRGKNVPTDEEHSALFAIKPNGRCETPIASVKGPDLNSKGGRRNILFRQYGDPAWRPGVNPGALHC